MSLYQSYSTFFKTSKICSTLYAGLSLVSLGGEGARKVALWGIIWMGLDLGPTFADLTESQKLGLGASFLVNYLTKKFLQTADVSAATACLIAPIATAAFFNCAEKVYTKFMEAEIMEEMEQMDRPRRQGIAGRAFMVG